MSDIGQQIIRRLADFTARKFQLEVLYREGLYNLDEELRSIRDDCPHTIIEYFPDPSGNNDYYRECKLCGLQKKHEKSFKKNHE